MRQLAIVIGIVAIAAILFGRLGHVVPIAIAGYVLIAVALVLTFLSRR